MKLEIKIDVDELEWLSNSRQPDRYEAMGHRVAVEASFALDRVFHPALRAIEVKIVEGQS